MKNEKWKKEKPIFIKLKNEKEQFFLKEKKNKKTKNNRNLFIKETFFLKIKKRERTILF